MKQPAPDNLPAEPVLIDARTHFLTPMHGADFSPQYLAIGEAVRVHAPIVAVDRRTRTVLYRFRRNSYVTPPKNCPAFTRGSVSN
jgi:hypothetical protein